MTPFVLPGSWDLLLRVDADPMSGGCTRVASIGDDTDLLYLRVVSWSPKRSDASLDRMIASGSIPVQDGRVCKLADHLRATVNCCHDEATAIRAVEEAAIIAGWCVRRT